MNNLWDSIFKALSLVIYLDQSLWEIIFVSLRVSLSAILIGLPFALFISYLLANSNWRFEKLVISINNTLVAVPAVVVGLVIYLLLSRRGLLGDLEWLFTQKAMILGQIFLAYPILLSISYSGFKGIAKEAKETAVTLGANRWQVALTLMFETRFILLTAITTAFGRIIAEVGCAMMVGGNILHHTRNMTTAIALETNKGEYSQAIALGIVLLVFAFAINFSIIFFKQKKAI